MVISLSSHIISIKRGGGRKRSSNGQPSFSYLFGSFKLPISFSHVNNLLSSLGKYVDNDTTHWCQQPSSGTPHREHCYCCRHPHRSSSRLLNVGFIVPLQFKNMCCLLSAFDSSLKKIVIMLCSQFMTISTSFAISLGETYKLLWIFGMRLITHKFMD